MTLRLSPRWAPYVFISPFLVLFAVFFWAFLWGIPGAFIGVPILIAVLTLCANHPSSRWVADLALDFVLGGSAGLDLRKARESSIVEGHAAAPAGGSGFGHPCQSAFS